MKKDWSRTNRREETRIWKQIGAGQIEKKEIGYKTDWISTNRKVWAMMSEQFGEGRIEEKELGYENRLEQGG